jgi:ParB/RepB/Spo0J family partition protein
MTIQSIPLDRLLEHPLNANRMSEQTFKKLLRNIERTGLYEPIVVRPHPEMEGSFQIINGHHRIKALKMLGQDTANCVVWNVDDNEAAILLATLNRLQGSDILEKKIELLNKLKEHYQSGQLAKLLPQTKKQIEALANLKVPAVPSKADENVFARPLVFFVTPQQAEIIESAMSIAIEKVTGQTTAEKKAKALTYIVNQWMHPDLPHRETKKLKVKSQNLKLKSF